MSDVSALSNLDNSSFASYSMKAVQGNESACELGCQFYKYILGFGPSCDFYFSVVSH